jgi:hypothetical protein
MRAIGTRQYDMEASTCGLERWVRNCSLGCIIIIIIIIIIHLQKKFCEPEARLCTTIWASLIPAQYYLPAYSLLQNSLILSNTDYSCLSIRVTCLAQLRCGYIIPLT